jgi:hypothetical protein
VLATDDPTRLAGLVVTLALAVPRGPLEPALHAALATRTRRTKPATRPATPAASSRRPGR